MAFLKGNILLQKTNYSRQRHEHILTVLLTLKLSFVPRIFTTIVNVLPLNVKRSIRKRLLSTNLYRDHGSYVPNIVLCIRSNRSHDTVINHDNVCDQATKRRPVSLNNSNGELTTVVHKCDNFVNKVYANPISHVNLLTLTLCWHLNSWERKTKTESRKIE